MESSNQPISHPAQLSTQGYNHQMQQAMWTGNTKTCQTISNQSTNMDSYSQQMNRYYQAPYPSQTNDMSRFASNISKDQNSNSMSYSHQYSVPRQTNYCSPQSQNYVTPLKSNCSNNIYYNNMNSKKISSNNIIPTSKKYSNSNLGLSLVSSGVPHSSQVSSSATPMPQMPQYSDHTNYSMQNMYMSNYAGSNSIGNEKSYLLPKTMTPSTQSLSSYDTSSIHSVSIVLPSQVSQVSSIPTPPETSLPNDTIPIENTSFDGTGDNAKMNISNSTFALPGMVSHLPNNVSSVGNRNAGNNLQPPPNVDEGSQASSASASSSLPDEQNVKTNSKPNFSYPPTPNTLSSPGAASMSSFHDDLECISSPGWPKTPASPVANSSYEFANIKRPDNLLKLYTLSDEPDRRYFLDKLIVFSEDIGSPITQCPTISKQPLDVFKVYLTVKERGGFVEVTNAKRWKDIAGAIGVGASSSAAYTLRKQYMKLLLPFECKFDRGGIDPQPIINMVEASSRKKGKNSGVANYGNPNLYNQNYPQSVERYHSGYPGSYQSSRYQCSNSTNYCSLNPIHYPTSAAHNVSISVPTGQNHYNQYSPNSQSNYSYYQNNNANASGYNNVQNNLNVNICHFGRIITSTPDTCEHQVFYPQYNITQNQGATEMYNTSRGCSIDTMLTTNQSMEDHDSSHHSLHSTIEPSSIKRNEQIQQSVVDNYENISMDSSLSGSTELSQDKMCFINDAYSTAQNAVLDKNVASGIAINPPYQQTTSENLPSKPAEMNYYPEPPSTPHPVSSQYPNRNQSLHHNQSQNSYSNKKLPYQGEYNNKTTLPNQYARFTDTQNESYRGSEGPPGIQVDRTKHILPNEITATSPKSQQCTNSSSKSNMYNYSVQQNHNKNMFSNTAYCNSYSNRSQREKAWHPEQNHHPYPMHSGQRPQIKNQTSIPEGKPTGEIRPRKSWVTFRESSQVQNKPLGSSTPISTLSQTMLLNRSQVNSLPAIKKPLEFPPHSVESVRAVAVKRRRCPAKRITPIDPWRLMLSLRSGLLVESAWALDALSILLADNCTVIYFNLNHLPGLLQVLVDYYRCFLNKIFNLALDLEIKKSSDSSCDIQSSGTSDFYEWEEKVKILDAPNFTFKTRCKKKVEIQYDEALFLIDPLRTWDIYEDFDVDTEHWQKGGGDITTHIQSIFATESKKIKFCRELINEKSKPKIRKVLSKDKCVIKSSILNKGEPVVVLKKFNFLINKLNALADSDLEIDNEDSCSNMSSSSILSKKTDLTKKEDSEKDIIESNDESSNLVDATTSNILFFGKKCDTVVASHKENKDVNIEEIKEVIFSIDSKKGTSENFAHLRGSLSSRKRFLSEDVEDEAYCFDEPALYAASDSQEMLSRRCVCVSTILRNLSFVPNNDLVMSKNPGVLVLLGRLLLLNHEHKPSKPYHKYERDIDLNMSWNDSCTSLKNEHEWWWSTLNVLRDNTLVILSNISGQLDLSPFPEEVSLPILDGLLHWIVCPSSYAQDPLPSRFPTSVLSPQRLCLEALCKLSVLSSNLDLIIATPPWSRIEELLAFLTKCLCIGQDQIMREFALILLSNISHVDSVAAKTIAEQGCSISYLISFIEEAESNAFQIASSQGTKKLRDKPELMGTTPEMVQRAATTLKNLALVPENQSLFMRYQPRLLSLVMSQVMDQELAAIIADVLFYCSENVENICDRLSIS